MASERIRFARKLRRESSDVEDILWQQLRARRFCGLKFRRQVPLGRYFADFVCEAETLIVEVDGWQHLEQADYDKARTDVLKSHGYRVVRFWSDDVRHKLDDVLIELKSYVGDTPDPADTHGGTQLHVPSSALRAPSPRGEGLAMEDRL